MPQLSLKLTTTLKRDQHRKKQLIQAIQTKRNQLERLVVKVEMLRVNLQIAKQEYMMKVGSLFLKDSHLDLEIIRYKNILHLMNKGLSYNEAVQKLRQTYYSEQIEIEREQQKMKREEEIYRKRAENNNLHPHSDIKKIWKKLISRFHPDLIQDRDEKLRRDKIMQQINAAYQEGDYDQLIKIENENFSHTENTIDNLEEILLKVLDEITQKNEIYKSLKISEWHGWMEKINKAKKKSVNIFADTEKKLLNDITAKLDIVNNLKKQINEKEGVIAAH